MLMLINYFDFGKMIKRERPLSFLSVFAFDWPGNISSSGSVVSFGSTGMALAELSAELDLVVTDLLVGFELVSGFVFSVKNGSV
jgi:hypothetical protein